MKNTGLILMTIACVKVDATIPKLVGTWTFLRYWGCANECSKFQQRRTSSNVGEMFTTVLAMVRNGVQTNENVPRLSCANECIIFQCWTSNFREMMIASMALLYKRMRTCLSWCGRNECKYLTTTLGPVMPLGRCRKRCWQWRTNECNDTQQLWGLIFALRVV